MPSSEPEFGRAKAEGPLRAWGQEPGKPLGGPAPQGGAGPYGLPALAGMEKDAFGTKLQNELI